MYFIYKYVYRGEIIYIGKTKRDLSERIYEHSVELKFLPYLNESKIYYFELPTHVEMDIYEKYLINVYMPKLNVVDTDGARFNFKINEPKWKRFSSNGVRKQEKRMTGSCMKLPELDKKLKLRHQLDELESELFKLENFESWLEQLFEEYVTGWDIRLGYVYYFWDMDANPLPEDIILNGKHYACFISSRIINDGGRYENKISQDIAKILLTHGHEYFEAEYQNLRGKILDIEYEIERI